MSSRILWLLAFPALALSVSDSFMEAQKTAALAERLRMVAEATTLDSPGSAPFHLKLSVEILPQRGRIADKGTVELWWNAPNQSRIVYDLSQYRATTVRTPNGLFETPDAGYLPYIVHHLLGQVLHPISDKLNSTDYKMEAVKQPFGKTQLDCIATYSSSAKPLDMARTTFCFDDRAQLRVILANPDQYNLRQTLGTLGTHHVPLDLQYTFLHNVVGTAHIDALQSQRAPYKEASDIADLQKVPEPPPYIPGQNLSGTLLRRPDPVYPEEARQKHIYGTVLLHGVITVDGRVKSLSLIGSPDDSLTASAMEAVSKWTYQPYLQNNVPTEVDTTVTINYTFR